MKLKLHITPWLVEQCFNDINPTKEMHKSLPVCGKCIITVAARQALLDMGQNPRIVSSCAGEVQFYPDESYKMLRSQYDKEIYEIMETFDKMAFSGNLDLSLIPEQVLEVELNESWS